MQLNGNTILITGGATGIGLALAESFLQAGNEVLICGRRESKLLEAKAKFPNLHIKVCDLEEKAARNDLFVWATTQFRDVNILINNAGIQKEVNFQLGEKELYENGNEIAINLEASIHLAALFTPYFLKQKQECAIVNVSSGLGIVPLAIMPIYCATKAGLHSFSISLRKQLETTNVKVFEIIPPIVDTELDRGARARRGQEETGISTSVVVEETMKSLQKNTYEIAVGMVKVLRVGARIAPGFFHKMMNKRVTK